MFKFGIIGCGNIARAYGRAIAELPEATIDCVYDIDAAHSAQYLESFGEAHPGMRALSSWAEMLASEVDAICICLPSGIHVPYAVEAARAGKNVVVEKPLGITLAQLDEMEQAAKETGVKVGCISQLYFTDGYQKLKRAVDAGQLGKPYLMEVSMKYYRTPEYFLEGGWRGTWAMDGGGALMNQGIHGISLMLMLMGPVRSIRASVKTLAHDIEVEDTALAILEFENGALGSVVGTTSCAPGFDRRISVHGEKGSVILCEEEIERWDVAGETWTGEATGAESTASNPGAFGKELHARQLADFIDAVRADRQPTLSIREGRAPVEVILGIYRASQTGETVYLNQK